MMRTESRKGKGGEYMDDDEQRRSIKLISQGVCYIARSLGVGTNKDTLEMQCVMHKMRRDEGQIGVLL